jgi:putative transposase
METASSFKKKTTQLFVIIPYGHLINQLKYKAAEYGNNIELVDESFTSKCSFLDKEQIDHNSTYLGK